MNLSLRRFYDLRAPSITRVLTLQENHPGFRLAPRRYASLLNKSCRLRSVPHFQPVTLLKVSSCTAGWEIILIKYFLTRLVRVLTRLAIRQPALFSSLQLKVPDSAPMAFGLWVESERKAARSFRRAPHQKVPRLSAARKVFHMRIFVRHEFAICAAC